jgi:signal transduction histidine kinase/CheY-like chemotaxis protein
VSAHLQMAHLRQEKNEAIRESEERFRALTNATSNVIYCMSADWREMYYLKGRNFVIDTNYPSKKWLNKYLHKDDHKHIMKTIQKAIKSKSVLELEHRVFQVDGTIGWTHSRAIPIFNKEGEIVEWFGAASDVTRRKKAELALLDASRHKDEFLATLAHELRNPLTPMIHALKVMKIDKNNKCSVEKAQAIMERQITHLNRLIEDLLDLNRITHGKIKLHKENLDVVKIIHETVEAIIPAIEAQGHTLQFNQPSFPIYVKADKTRIAQIFSNLLDNANKYTEKEGLIRLFFQIQSEQVFISVRDNGIGIPHQMLSCIFDKFTQIDRQLERPQCGLGIGLSLVKELVELHDGAIEVKSKGKNRGSEFIVRLPIISTITETNGCDFEQLDARHSLRILLVDDNIDIIESLTMLLEFMGHTIEGACDGIVALEKAASFSPDLILMDIGMPKLNGYETAKAIRARFPEKNIILAAMTGQIRPENCPQSLEAGFDFHITKPFQLETLEKLFRDVKHLVSSRFETV